MTVAPAPPPPAAPKRRNWLGIGCLSVVGLVVLVIIASFIADAVTGDNKAAVKAPVVAATHKAATHTAAPAPPAPVPSPNGTYRGDCNYLLGNFGSTMRFVADANLHNTGNIGTVVRVKVHWVFAGSNGIVRQKRVRVKAGHHKRITFTVHATSDDIDAYQATSSGNECHVKASILRVFGKPRAQ